MFAPDGGLRVSLKGTERQRERETEGKIIKRKKRGRKGRERGRYRDNKKAERIQMQRYRATD